MTCVRYIVAFCVLSWAVSALPSSQPSDPVGSMSVPFRKRLRTRTDHLKSRQDDLISAPLHNNFYDYLIDVRVGSSAQPFSLMLDTGSSDIFVFGPDCSSCSGNYFNSSASNSFTALSDLGEFSIGYGDGSGVSGSYASDQVGVGNTVTRQTIGIATQASGIGFEDGIFGLGLDEGESIVYHKNKHSYPGYLTTLKNNGLIGSRAYSIHFNSRAPNDEATGTIWFGAYEQKEWTGDLVFFPMIEKAPDGQYRLDVWEPTLTYGIGDGPVEVDTVNEEYTVIIDTGTPLSHIPEKQFNTISEAVGAQVIGDGPGYSVDCSLANEADGIHFEFYGPEGSVVVSVPWSEMVIPLDSGTLAGRCLFGLIPRSNKEMHGVYILGDTFIRSAYLLFDYDAVVVGIAQANFDH